MAYVPNFFLKATGIFVILLSCEGFKCEQETCKIS